AASSHSLGRRSLLTLSHIPPLCGDCVAAERRSKSIRGGPAALHTSLPARAGPSASVENASRTACSPSSPHCQRGRPSAEAETASANDLPPLALPCQRERPIPRSRDSV